MVIVLDAGKISALEWRNSCYKGQGCDEIDCEDSSIVYDGVTFEEKNCFKPDCSTAGDNECDTQVFVTWVGRDSGRDDCTSDNYRLSGFADFSMVSYLDAARALINL